MEDAIASMFRPASATAPEGIRERWTLDKISLDALLQALHPKPEEAALRYAALHRRLTRFFEWNRAEQPGALADEAVNRLARRVSSSTNEDDAVRQPEAFAAGIARLLLREQRRASVAVAGKQTQFALHQKDLSFRQQEQSEKERLFASLDECLAQLSEPQRSLIQRYYSTESREQIDARKTLASELGISLNALRNRALRVRESVEACARKRLAKR